MNRMNNKFLFSGYILYIGGSIIINYWHPDSH